MIYMNHDFFDYFDVLFGKKLSIVNGIDYPLGYFAAEALEIRGEVIRELRELTRKANDEFEIFLSARTASSGAVARQELIRAWDAIKQLPLYNKFPPEKVSGISELIATLRANPEKADEMLTPGTQEYEMLQQWRDKLCRLADDIRTFRRNTEQMLKDYFEKLPSRRPEAYAGAFANYHHDYQETYRAAEDDEDIKELNRFQFDFPVRISFVTEKDPKTGVPFLAEQMTFEDLVSFLYMDLYRGMAVGNIPRVCHNCKKWFLAIGAYDAVYCQRAAPGETNRTCRQVGAHRKEKEKNGSELGYIEYDKVYNRLKSRKRRGTITIEQWNQQVAYIQELKEAFLRGEIDDADYKMKLNKI